MSGYIRTKIAALKAREATSIIGKTIARVVVTDVGRGHALYFFSDDTFALVTGGYQQPGAARPGYGYMFVLAGELRPEDIPAWQMAEDEDAERRQFERLRAKFGDAK